MRRAVSLRTSEVVPVDERACGCRAELIERGAGKTEPRKRRGVSPLGRRDAELLLRAASVEHEHLELVLRAGVGLHDEDDPVPRLARELDFSERCRTDDAPALPNRAARGARDPYFADAGAQDDELGSVCERTPGLAGPRLSGRNPLLGRLLLHYRAVRSVDEL